MGSVAGTIGARRARRELAALRAMAGVVLAVFGAGWATGAVGPAFGSLNEFSPEAPAATLVRNGDEVIITGSVNHIFFASTFAGPNRAEKRDRLRPYVDVMAMSGTFEGIRARIAALRKPTEDAAAAIAEETTVDEPIIVASLSPEVTTEALTAIDEAALGGSSAPMPSAMSDQLAYARADAPTTIFDGVLKDKKGNVVSEKEFNCMATAIYFEARGESYKGQVAVGQVVLNRVAHRLYPDTICNVVYQNKHKRNACQFSFACDGIPERIYEMKSWAQAEEIARGVISGELYLPEVGYATHYHANYVKPRWAPRMKRVAKIGHHIFYHFKRGWKFG